MIKIFQLLRFILPLVLFAIIGVFFWRGLSINPRQVPSALINKPVPRFKLPDLGDFNHYLSRQVFIGHVSLLNVWATWCDACHKEHPVLIDIARSKIVPVYGLDYKDQRAKALNWLRQYGNPYTAIGFDRNGSAAINWGVYGTPETFVIDKQGIIRYKQIGPITKEIWQHKLLPLVLKLKQ